MWSLITPAASTTEAKIFSLGAARAMSPRVNGFYRHSQHCSGRYEGAGLTWGPVWGATFEVNDCRFRSSCCSSLLRRSLDIAEVVMSLAVWRMRSDDSVAGIYTHDLKIGSLNRIKRSGCLEERKRANTRSTPSLLHPRSKQWALSKRLKSKNIEVSIEHVPNLTL